MTEKEVHSPAVLSAETVARAKAGDREALGQIYEATSTEIYRTIHAMVRDEQTVLDIQQDVYVQAFSHLDQLREPDSLRPWLRQIAVNRVRLQFRKEMPLLFTELSSEDDGPVPDFPDLHEEGAPALELEKKETARLVRQILDKLSDGQRLLIGMYYYEQMPVKKIAENLGISESAVKVQR
jgi:RNA polymerase sigma factor (sigma-70 family)